jgi:hypothetical protein
MDIADILFHVHPDLSEPQRVQVENGLREYDGVISVHFSPEHSHELTVAYDPRKIGSKQLLERVRTWDPAATMVGL